MQNYGKLNVLGTRVDAVDKKQSMEVFEELMQQDGCSIVVTPNSEIIFNANRQPRLRHLINQADFVLPDGIGVVYASRILKHPLPDRLTGVDFAYDGLKLCARNGWSVFMLGARPGIAEKAAEKLREQIPELVVAGCADGYFRDADEPSIVEQINSSGAKLLLVAMGSPRQELFIEKHRQELGVNLAVGVGGSFDVWSGTLKRAPKIFIDLGLEWLYRLAQEPTRIKRMAVLPIFIIDVFLTRRQNADS